MTEYTMLGVVTWITNNMKLYAIISMTIVFAILAWIVSLNVALAGCVGKNCPESQYRDYDEDSRDRDFPIHRYDDYDHHRAPVIIEHHHNDELED